MGHLVFVILQMRMLRIQFVFSVLLAAVLLIRGIYWQCRGRNPYVYGFLWILPLISLFAGKWKLFEGGVFEYWETFFWEIFDEISVFGVVYWAIAAALCISYGIGKRRLIRRGRKYPVKHIYGDEAALAEMRPAVERRVKWEVRVSDLQHSPYTVGVIHPYIVLPADYESRYGDDELQMVLLHEATHIRCRHNFFFCVASVLKCMFWLNPIVRYSARAFQTDMEMFCDSKVAERNDRAEYGKLLLDSVRSTQAPVNVLQKVNLFFSKSECRARIEMLSAYRDVFARHRKRIFQGIGIVFLAAAAVVLANSRFMVSGGEGIEAVISIEGEGMEYRTELSLTSEEYGQIVKEERADALVIDTKVLRERLRKSGYPSGMVNIWFDTYRFGPGASGVRREEAVCSLYDSSERYITLEKGITGWQRIMRYL